MTKSDIIGVRKQSSGGLSTHEVMATFKNAQTIEEIKQAVESADERLAFAWASVDIRDRDGERIPIEDVISNQETLLKRGGSVTDHHTNKVVGTTIAYRVMDHPSVGKIGVLHLYKIFNDNKLDDSVWAEIQSGERTGLSVGGLSEGISIEIDGTESTKILEQFAQYETASVFRPANPLALNEAISAIAKSDKSKIEKFEAIIRKDGKIFKLKYIIEPIDEDQILDLDGEPIEIMEDGTIKATEMVKQDIQKEDKKELASVIKEKEGDTLIPNHKGENLMTDETKTTGSILDSALEKIAKGEVLSKAESQAILQSHAEKSEMEPKEPETKEEEPEGEDTTEEEEKSEDESDEDEEEEEKSVDKGVESLKAQISDLTNVVKSLVKKSSPQRPLAGATQTAPKDVSKAAEIYTDAVAIAKGEKRVTFHQVHKQHRQELQKQGLVE